MYKPWLLKPTGGNKLRGPSTDNYPNINVFVTLQQETAGLSRYSSRPQQVSAGTIVAGRGKLQEDNPGGREGLEVEQDLESCRKTTLALGTTMAVNMAR